MFILGNFHLQFKLRISPEKAGNKSIECFFIKVPPGVVVLDDATGRILKDFNRAGEKVRNIFFLLLDPEIKLLMALS